MMRTSEKGALSPLWTGKRAFCAPIVTRRAYLRSGLAILARLASLIPRQLGI
jgi:hypothetical protein